jgi:hypothetical protein
VNYICTLGACLGRQWKQSGQRQASLIFICFILVNIHVTSNGQGKNENWKKEKEGKAKNKKSIPSLAGRFNNPV